MEWWLLAAGIGLKWGYDGLRGAAVMHADMKVITSQLQNLQSVQSQDMQRLRELVRDSCNSLAEALAAVRDDQDRRITRLEEHVNRLHEHQENFPPAIKPRLRHEIPRGCWAPPSPPPPPPLEKPENKADS